MPSPELPSSRNQSPKAPNQIRAPPESPELIKVPAQPISLDLEVPLEMGVQEWPNGWKYEGEFEENLKHGHGVFQWENGECYIGQFFKDHRHGNGTYTWPDGSKFTGMFYLDRKDGYGTLEVKDGSIFQGLYKADERFGPGVLTYPSGRQDVGLWYRNHLIRLCSKIPGAFTLKDHPLYHSDIKELDIPVKAYKEKYFWRNDPEEDPFFYPYKKFLFDDNYTLPAEIGTYSTDADHLPLTRSYTRDGDRHFFQEEEELGDEDKTDKVTITNQTPLMVKMQLHIHRHRHFQAKQTWNVAAIIEGNREDFSPKGPIECSSEQLIIAAKEGDRERVRKILETNLVSADVADVNGHIPLIGASVACNGFIINMLLDSGANVNKLNNEGVSAFNCITTLYYPTGSFLHSDIYRLANKKEAPMKKGMQLGSDEELTTQVKMAKRISVYDDQIRLGSISYQKTLPVSLLLGNSNELKQVGEQVVELVEEQIEAEEILDLEDFLEEEGTELGSDDMENILSPSAGPPSVTHFESSQSLHHYQFEVTERHLRRAAQVLSRNKYFRRVTEKDVISPDFKHDERVWRIAAMKSQHRKRGEIINLLLRRGADPNISTNPIPPLFSAVLTGDLNAVASLLANKADPNIRLKSQMKELDGLVPLHAAVAIPGKKAVAITQLLLNAAANPDKGANDADVIYAPDLPIEPEMHTGFIMKSPNLLGVPSHYHAPSDIIPVENGRTPLHIAGQREDSYKHAHEIISLLLKHKANPNVLWSGHSPLSISIASGNDLAVNELLANGADPNLPLTRGVGSALCAAVNTAYEHKRSLAKRLALVTKLLEANANILMPIEFTSPDGQVVGTALDYGYYKYYQDSKIAQTSYHALTPEEREIYNARHELLSYLSQPFRASSITKERKRFDDIIQNKLSQEFSETHSELSESEALSFADISQTAKAIFERRADGTLPSPPASEKKSKIQDTAPKRQLFKFKFCYYCGRSVSVRLIPCSRCKEVYYCSKACKVAAWNEFHKDECFVSKGRTATKKGKDDGGLFVDDGLTWSRSTSASVELDNYSYN